ncbi:hypothetical protein HS961_01585 [Comamonas piscis]|uniref:Uncharacterized protein n=1 Tax=Comamonas piscis TaxID=1562974 RepID=A0A7G5ECA3_9BURK|nr:hypothetical protein [Comamonas piscis]QMV71628.1 hypothetical protein HS961_01585 [Comamonas piscis]WSO34350.1 hypothetical protein VUJ63_01595 [Comamonas piscis]
MKKSKAIYISAIALACVAGLVLGIKNNKELTNKTVQKMTDGFLAIKAGDEIIQSNDIRIAIEKNDDLGCYFEKISESPLRDLNTCLQNPLCVQMFNANHPFNIKNISNAFQKGKFCKNKQADK